MDDDVDAAVFEIDVARGEVADFESAFAAGGQDDGKVNLFLDAFHFGEALKW